jgi:hypothetical protein
MEENDPFLERPDEHELVGDELFCWLPGNGDRQCGGDCVSYEPGCEGDTRMSSCMFLNAVRSLAAGVGVMAKVQHQTKVSVAREVHRAHEPVPPEVKS